MDGTQFCRLQLNDEKVRSRIEALVRKAWSVFGYDGEPVLQWDASGDYNGQIDSLRIEEYSFLQISEYHGGGIPTFTIEASAPVYSPDGIDPPDVSIATVSTHVSWQGALFALLRWIEADRLEAHLNPMIDAWDAEDEPPVG